MPSFADTLRRAPRRGTQARYNEALEADEPIGREAEADFLDRAREFDPQEGFERYARGSYERIFEGQGGVRDILRDLQGRSVGAGRLNTGFYDEDQGDVVEGGLASLNSELSRGALAASGQDLSRIGLLGDYSMGARNRYLEMLAGQLDRETAERNARRQSRSGVFGVLGGVAGSIFGGPIGGAIGSQIGDMFGP